MRAYPILAAALLASAAAAPAPPPVAPAACTTAIPAEFALRPARWLGGCTAGKAEGLGVMRFGAAAPYAFFVGRMRTGRPVTGMLINPDGLFRPAKGFDSRLEAIDTDGNRRAEQDAVFALAGRAAEATARRFAAMGNPGSASFYHAMAKRIANGQPE